MARSSLSIEAQALQAVDKYVRDNKVGRSLNGYDPHGEPEGIIDDPNQFIGLHASTHILVKDMADLLVRHYPGFRWAVQPSEFGKVFNIFCLDFSGRWGYRIRYADIVNDPKRRAVVKAGREMLRRFQYPGTVYKPDRMAAIKRNDAGEAIPDVSDFKRSRFRERVMLEQAIADGKAKVVGKSNGHDVVEVKL